MPPEVEDLLLEARRDYLHRESLLHRELARRWLQVEDDLRDEVLELARALARVSPQPIPVWRLYQDRRFRSLFLQTQTLLGNMGEIVESEFWEETSREIERTLASSRLALEMEALDTGVSLHFDKLDLKAVRNAAFHVRDNTPFTSLLSGASTVGRDAFGRHLVSSIALGLSPRDAAAKALRSGLGQSYTRFLTIYRTEMTRVQRFTSAEVYSSTGRVRGYRRLSAKDRRTCLSCLLMDGVEFPLDHPFDQHPNCRCILRPILLADTRPFVRGTDWLRSQPTSVQRRFLGPRRFELFEQGMPLMTFVTRHDHPIWGSSFVDRPLTDLRAGLLPDPLEFASRR